MEAQSLPTAEKFIAKASALKFMGNVFWDEADLLLVDISHHGDCNCCVSMCYTLKGYSWSLLAEGQSYSASQSLFSSIISVPILPTEIVTGYSSMHERLHTPPPTASNSRLQFPSLWTHYIAPGWQAISNTDMKEGAETSVHHSPLSTADVMNDWRYTTTLPLWIHDFHGDNLMFTRV